MKKSYTDLSKESGIKRGTIWFRVNRRGMSVQQALEAPDERFSHRMSKTRTYRIWQRMKRRCSDEKDISYKWYGARGVTVCERWLSFKSFFEDMGECPEGMTIDRIDNSQGYFPDNCRWMSQKQQQRNRSNNKLITWKGETKCINEWAEILGVQKATLWWRIKNWSLDRAMETR